MLKEIKTIIKEIDKKNLLGKIYNIFFKPKILVKRILFYDKDPISSKILLPVITLFVVISGLTYTEQLLGIYPQKMLAATALYQLCFDENTLDDCTIQFYEDPDNSDSTLSDTLCYLKNSQYTLETIVQNLATEDSNFYSSINDSTYKYSYNIYNSILYSFATFDSNSESLMNEITYANIVPPVSKLQFLFDFFSHVKYAADLNDFIVPKYSSKYQLIIKDYESTSTRDSLLEKLSIIIILLIYAVFIWIAFKRIYSFRSFFLLSSYFFLLMILLYELPFIISWLLNVPTIIVLMISYILVFAGVFIWWFRTMPPLLMVPKWKSLLIGGVSYVVLNLLFLLVIKLII